MFILVLFTVTGLQWIVKQNCPLHVVRMVCVHFFDGILYCYYSGYLVKSLIICLGWCISGLFYDNVVCWCCTCKFLESAILIQSGPGLEKHAVLMVTRFIRDTMEFQILVQLTVMGAAVALLLLLLLVSLFPSLLPLHFSLWSCWSSSVSLPSSLSSSSTGYKGIFFHCIPVTHCAVYNSIWWIGMWLPLSLASMSIF